MAAFVIESIPELSGALSGQALTSLTVLTGGGFAVLLQGSGTAELVTFGVADDGGAVRIGSDVAMDLQLSASLRQTADGGFAVVDRVSDLSDPTTNRNVLTYFDAQGTSSFSASFSGTLAVRGFDLTLDPLQPEYWGVRNLNGVGSLVQLDPLKLHLHDPFVEANVADVLMPRLFFDGGFQFTLGLTPNEVRQAEAMRPDIGPLPSFADPSIFAASGTLISAGNKIVRIAYGDRPISGGAGFEFAVTVSLYNPDGSAPVVVLDEGQGSNLTSGGPVYHTEVPGIGYALLIIKAPNFSATAAEVRLFDYNGVELGRQTLEGMNGDRINQLEFRALVDPDHATVRLVAAWTPLVLNPDNSLASGPSKAEVVVIQPGDGLFTVGTDFADYLSGLALADDLFGGAGGDVLDGFGGEDALFGDLGDDRIRGGSGNDLMEGEEGSDFLDGGDGEDRIKGGGGNDSILAGSGRDTVSGAVGSDLIFGEDGADVLAGGLDNDALFGDAGSDRMQGDAGQDVLEGGGGNDLLSGGDGNDLLEGDTQQDTLSGGAGSDTLKGGDGNDRLHATSGDLGDVETSANLLEGGRGADVLFGSKGDDTLDGGDGNDVIFGDGGAGAGNDRIVGGDGSDDLFGGSGDDDISGGRGADTLVGGLGFDLLSGGLGKDRLLGGEGVDSFIFASAEEAGLGTSRDLIRDFSVDDDVIDLTGVFAATPVFIQGNAFSGTQAELRYLSASGIIEGDVNGDGTADFQIELKGAPSLTGAEFVF